MFKYHNITRGAYPEVKLRPILEPFEPDQAKTLLSQTLRRKVELSLNAPFFS